MSSSKSSTEIALTEAPLFDQFNLTPSIFLSNLCKFFSFSSNCLSRYVAPEYVNTGLLNEGSDAYSFGVLLMELISGRNPVDYSRPVGEVGDGKSLTVLILFFFFFFFFSFFRFVHSENFDQNLRKRKMRIKMWLLH